MKSPIIEEMHSVDAFSAVAGLEKITATIRSAFTTSVNCAPFLILGPDTRRKYDFIQSLLAKSDRPIYEIHFAWLHKLFGHTENILRDTLKETRDNCPCILLAKDLESYFGSLNEGGIRARIAGTFLSWISEKPQNLLVVLTSSDFINLPPEFLRPGRTELTVFIDDPDKDNKNERLQSMRKWAKDYCIYYE